MSRLLRLSPVRGTRGAVGWTGRKGLGATKLLDKKLTSSSTRVVSSTLVALRDELPPTESILEEPEEKELEESKSLPVFLSLTDFISCKNAAILSGVTPMVG